MVSVGDRHKGFGRSRHKRAVKLFNVSPAVQPQPCRNFAVHPVIDEHVLYAPAQLDYKRALFNQLVEGVAALENARCLRL